MVYNPPHLPRTAQQCPNGHAVPSGAQFCPVCSLPLATVLCAQGHWVDPRYRYCAQCGSSVGAWLPNMNGRPHVKLVAPASSVLLTYPRCGMWRRVGAALIDVVLASLALALGPLTLVVICVYGYFEGTTGQTLGKKALRIYTIRADTGEFLGGAAGIGRQLLHFLDYITLMSGYIVGLITGRTYADRIMGTIVVREP
jgi:hypothetical protein